MKTIAFTGTLDPITNGHMWVIGEARAMADEVMVFLSENPSKKPQFSAEQRKEIIEQSARERGWDNVQVIVVKGDYTARAAKHRGVDYLIRGIRNTSDFDYENLIQQTNVDVLRGAKTIFVMPPRDLGSVSSSFVKGLQGPVGWHWTVRTFVPRPAYEAWIRDWLRKEWEQLWNYPSLDQVSSDNADHWFQFLTGADSYGGHQRHYHSIDHLVHGLSELRVWGANNEVSTRDLNILRKAFWFHDAVYAHGPAEVSNEEASAQLWLDADLMGDDHDDVAALIRATDHFQEASIENPLKDVMLGADLAILGQDAEIYQLYAAAIRQEYIHVPEAVYREHRAKALRSLCDKAKAGALFGDGYFSHLYKEQAIVNMGAEIAALEKA